MKDIILIIADESPFLELVTKFLKLVDFDTITSKEISIHEKAHFINDNVNEKRDLLRKKKDKFLSK